MHLRTKIIKLYPKLTSKDFGIDGTIVLQDDADGNGPYIAKWEHPEFKKPTKTQLNKIKEDDGDTTE